MDNINYMKLDLDQVGLYDSIFGLDRMCLNMPARIDIVSEIDEKVAVEAMRYTLKNLPYLTLRIHEKQDLDGTLPYGTKESRLAIADNFSQYYYDGEPEGLDIVDMSDKSDEEVDQYILERASSDFTGNNYNDSQLYDVKFIRKSGDRSTLYFCGYHMIMDTVGLMYAVTYYDKVYAAMLAGTELPAPGIGIEEEIEKSWTYFDSKKMEKDIEWGIKLYETEPTFASMNPHTYPEYVPGKKYGKKQNLFQMACVSLPKRIPADIVALIDKDALEHNSFAMLYYGLALRTWLSLNSGSDDVHFYTTGARRETVLRKHVGLTTAHMIPIRSVVSKDKTFREGIHELGVAQKESFRHITVNMYDFITPIDKKFDVPEDCTYHSTVFTYQPYFNIENSNLKFTAEHVNTGFATTPLYINMMPKDASGDLYADYLYANDYTDPVNLERFHSFMMKFVLKGIECPDMTINELVDYSMPED